MRLIDADALEQMGYVLTRTYQQDAKTMVYETKKLSDVPTIDAVPVGVVEQIRWERDVAMKQLAEHGIPFGGTADDVVPVVRCKDCKHRDPEDHRCDCGGHEWVIGKVVPVKDDWFCADGERT